MNGLLCTPDLVYCFFELISVSFQREGIIKYMNSGRISWPLNSNTNLLISRHLVLIFHYATMSVNSSMQAWVFALDSLSLHHKLYQRDFVFAKFGMREFSLLRNFVKPKFRLRRHEISQRYPRNFVSFKENSWVRTKDEIQRTSLSLLLHIIIINIIIIIIKNIFFHKETF